MTFLSRDGETIPQYGPGNTVLMDGLGRIRVSILWVRRSIVVSKFFDEIQLMFIVLRIFLAMHVLLAVISTVIVDGAVSCTTHPSALYLPEDYFDYADSVSSGASILRGSVRSTLLDAVNSSHRRCLLLGRLTAILLSRFTLDLRGLYFTDPGRSSSILEPSTSLICRALERLPMSSSRIVGNIGATIRSSDDTKHLDSLNTGGDENEEAFSTYPFKEALLT